MYHPNVTFKYQLPKIKERQFIVSNINLIILTKSMKLSTICTMMLCVFSCLYMQNVEGGCDVRRWHGCTDIKPTQKIRRFSGQYILKVRRGVFRTHSNIHDGIFLRTHSMAKDCQLFSQESSIIGVSQGSKYVSAYKLSSYISEITLLF